MSVADHVPAFMYNKRAPFSREIYRLARKYAARSAELGLGQARVGFWARLFGWWRRQ